MSFDRARFSAALKAHLVQYNLSLRDAAKASSVSASTLSRIANGELPDVESFASLVTWMQLDANQFLTTSNQRFSTHDAWRTFYASLYELRLPSECINALTTLVRTLVSKDGTQ